MKAQDIKKCKKAKATQSMTIKDEAILRKEQLNPTGVNIVISLRERLISTL